MRIFFGDASRSQQKNEISSFVEHIKARFNALKSTRNTILIIQRLEHESPEGYKYLCGVVSHNENLWPALRKLEKTNTPIVVALDLNKTFEEQWPEDLYDVESVDDLVGNAIIGVASDEEIQQLCLGARVVAKHRNTPFIRGVIPGGRN